MRRPFFAALMLLQLPLGALHAQTKPTDQTCHDVALANGGPPNQPVPRSCFALAVFVSATAPSIAEEVARMFPISSLVAPRDLQQKDASGAALSGTPAQGQATPGVLPAGVASGTIAAVGTRSGNQAIAAIGVNPVALFLADAASRNLARYSRFSDVTFFVPVSSLSSTSPSTDSTVKPKYFGARIRLNFTGISSGDAIWNRSDDLARNFMRRQAANVSTVQQVLESAPNLDACVKALLAPAANMSLQGSCGRTIALTVDTAEAMEMRREVAAIVRKADSKYLGLDLRVDVGDPTLGELQNAGGTFLFAGLAAGRRMDMSVSTVGVRTRLGLRHAALDSAAQAAMSGEADVGVEFIRRIDEQELNLSVGVESRFGNSNLETTQFQTNYAKLRGTLQLPLGSSNSVAVNFGFPIYGTNVSPTLSVNLNLGLLMSGKRGP